MKRIIIIAFLIFILIVGLLRPGGANEPNTKPKLTESIPKKDSSKPLHRKHPKPSLELGLWWITKTHSLCEHMVDSPRKGPLIRAFNKIPYAEEVYYHKWEVTGQEMIENDKCWIIDIKEFKSKLTCKASRQPPEFKIFIRNSDGSLAKEVVTRFSDDPFEKPQTSTGSGKSQKPVWIQEKRLALVVPWFPETWQSTLIIKKDMRSSFHKRAGLEFRQTTTTFSSMDLPNLKKMHIALVIGPKEKATTIIQTWDSICPWYRECHIVKEGDMINTPWRSETIDWKGKTKSTPPTTQDK